MIKIFNKYSIYIIVLLLIAMSYMFYLYINKEDEVIENIIEVKECENNTADTANSITKYYVDIKGEVVKPGIYEVDSDKRIIDVINKAGGLKNTADTSLLNLSKKVTDEMNIKIYSKNEIANYKNNYEKSKEPTVIEIIKEIEKECICPKEDNICENKNDALIETGSVSDNNNETSNDNKLININTATKEELMDIPGIGESKAESIIEYRKSSLFTSIEDIKNISGIGNSVFEKIKNYITV